jgi:carboxymethylenebutenolidase
LGFYVIVPDLFDKNTARTPEEGAALQQQYIETSLPRIASAIRALITHNRCNSRIAVVGWGMGGELAYQTAMLRQDIKATVVFSARPDPFIPMIPGDETPILAVYGDSDTSINPETLQRLREALSGERKGEVVVLPGEAGFTNDAQPTYNPDSTAKAWEKMVDFLCDYLGVKSRLE